MGQQKTNGLRKRILGIIVSYTAILLAAASALIIKIPVEITDILGAFAAVTLVGVVSYFIKISEAVYFSTLFFIFMASPMGSILEFYRSFGPYDKIVHFVSGILLTVYGMEILRNWAEKYERNSIPQYAAPIIFCACMFSSGAAGIWEVYEYLTDKLMGQGMQRGMEDTVTDIIAGNLGAVIYGCWSLLVSRKTERTKKGID